MQIKSPLKLNCSIIGCDTNDSNWPVKHIKSLDFNKQHNTFTIFISTFHSIHLVHLITKSATNQQSFFFILWINELNYKLHFAMTNQIVQQSFDVLYFYFTAITDY